MAKSLEKVVSSIRIAGHEYTVTYDKEEHVDWMGLCINNEEHIKINTNGAPYGEQLASLLHEIIEAINYRYEMDLEHHKIMTLETALYQILVDNPQLLSAFKG